MDSVYNLRNGLIDLAHALDDEQNTAHDLWTWLPSYKAARKAHGDYASEFRPSPADVMRETTVYLAQLKGYAVDDDEIRKWYGCPCQECEQAEGKTHDKD